METLSDRLKKSKKEWSDQGMRFVADTKEVGKGFVSFMHGEAQDWGEYLREQYKQLESQGRDILGPATDTERLKAQLDAIVARVTGKQEHKPNGDEQATTDQDNEEESADQVEA